jgi:hypothetical protein
LCLFPKMKKTMKLWCDVMWCAVVLLALVNKITVHFVSLNGYGYNIYIWNGKIKAIRIISGKSQRTQPGKKWNGWGGCVWWVRTKNERKNWTDIILLRTVNVMNERTTSSGVIVVFLYIEQTNSDQSRNTV